MRPDLFVCLDGCGDPITRRTHNCKPTHWSCSLQLWAIHAGTYIFNYATNIQISVWKVSTTLNTYFNKTDNCSLDLSTTPNMKCVLGVTHQLCKLCVSTSLLRKWYWNTHQSCACDGGSRKLCVVICICDTLCVSISLPMCSSIPIPGCQWVELYFVSLFPQLH